MTDITIKAEELHSFIIDLATRAGLSKSDAGILAESLIDADLKGIRSHGLIRLPIYIASIKSADVKKILGLKETQILRIAQVTGPIK